MIKYLKCICGDDIHCERIPPINYDLDTLKSTGQLFCRLSLNLCLSDVFSQLD